MLSSWPLKNTLTVDTNEFELEYYTKKCHKLKTRVDVRNLELIRLSNTDVSESNNNDNNNGNDDQDWLLVDDKGFHEFLFSMYNCELIQHVKLNVSVITNQLSIDQAVELFQFLGQDRFPNLTTIQFVGNKNSEEISAAAVTTPLPIEILTILVQQIPSLHELRIENNISLEGLEQQFRIFQDALANHKQLQKFQLVDSQLPEPYGMKYFIHGFLKVPTLNAIIFSFKKNSHNHNQSTFQFTEKLLNKLFQKSHLHIQEFKIENYRLSKESIESFSKVLGAQRKTNSPGKLKLNNCNISRKSGSMDIANMIANNTSLHVLELQNNHLDDEFCIQISSVVENKKMNFLQNININIGNPNISIVGHNAIMKAFQKHKNVSFKKNGSNTTVTTTGKPCRPSLQNFRSSNNRVNKGQTQNEWSEKERFEKLLNFSNAKKKTSRQRLFSKEKKKDNFKISYDSKRNIFSGTSERNIFSGISERNIFSGISKRNIFSGISERNTFSGIDNRKHISGNTNQNLASANNNRSLGCDNRERQLQHYTKEFRKIITRKKLEYLQLNKMKESAFAQKHEYADIFAETEFNEFLTGLYKCDAIEHVRINVDFLEQLSIKQGVELFECLGEFTKLRKIAFFGFLPKEDNNNDYDDNNNSKHDDEKILPIESLVLLLHRLPKLQHLSIENVSLEGISKTFKMVQDVLRRHMELQRFELLNSDLPSYGMKYLVDGLSQIPTLNAIVLSLKKNNKILSTNDFTEKSLDELFRKTTQVQKSINKLNNSTTNIVNKNRRMLYTRQNSIGRNIRLGDDDTVDANDINRRMIYTRKNSIGKSILLGYDDNNDFDDDDNDVLITSNEVATAASKAQRIDLVQELKIEHLRLSKESIRCFAKVLGTNSNNNDEDGQQLLTLSPRKLVLNDCGITKMTGSIDIANMMATNKSLHSLELKDNDLDNEFCLHIAKVIKNKNTNYLQHLVLNENPKITDVAQNALLDAFQKHKSIMNTNTKNNASQNQADGGLSSPLVPQKPLIELKQQPRQRKEWDQKEKFEALLKFKIESNNNNGTSLRQRHLFTRGQSIKVARKVQIYLYRYMCI